MKNVLALSLFAAGMSLLLFNCAAPGDETLDDDIEDVELRPQNTGGNPNTGGNHYLKGPHWAPDTQLAYRYLGDHALDAGNGVLPTVAIDPAYRVDVLSNAIECALGADQHVFDQASNTSIQGHFGLATSWMTGPLTPTQRRWVTGCMAQRLNATGAHVPILLEGNTSPIHVNKADNLAYPWNESTAWGDLFSSTLPVGGYSAPPYQLYVCSDSNLIAECSSPNTPSGWLDYRICDAQDYPCGLTYVGECSNYCTSYSTSRGTYIRCTGPDGVVWNETVHVQLQPTDGTCQPI